MKYAALVAAIVAAVVLSLTGAVGTALIRGVLHEAAAPVAAIGGCGNGTIINVDNRLPRAGGLSDEQTRNAAIIIKAGQQLKLPPRAWVIAVATAQQESKLRNLRVAVDHDSLGLFQQRPSSGWGTPEQILNPEYASRKFYEKLKTVKGWESMRLTDAAQAVQRSAFPDAYQQWEDLASGVVNALTGGAARTAILTTAGGDGGFTCATAGSISAAGWAVPVKGSINLLENGFRTAKRSTHDGVDIMAPRGTVIRAATDGIVTKVVCDTSIGSCDRDGFRGAGGCGWYMDILHANRVITRYCHMVERPPAAAGDHVRAGQVIGKVGSSGDSSGPHLHFEVHLNGDGSDAGAIDPVPFMAARGASLIG
ncbi:MAG: M23 family metallopeptidase [Micromonosporaceae bacterium]